MHFKFTYGTFYKYIIYSRFSPFGRYKLTNSDGTEEDALNLS